MSHPSIDHSGLSPSGRVSKKAREAWLKQEHDRLFPPGYWDVPEPTPQEKAKAEAQTLRLAAKNLRDLAERGMSRTKFLRGAADLEAKAASLEAQS